MSARAAATIAACRVFLRAASEPHLGIDHEALRGLAETELDWQWFAEYLCGCGLARPLLGVLNDAELRRSVPSAFLQALARCGVFDITRERVQREAIAEIEDALCRVGGHGVLLKGGAFLVRINEPAVARGTSDVDILVEPKLASPLRRYLLAHGFRGVANATPDAFHHMEPIAYQSVAVEIHTRILPAFWGLPESEMLATVRGIAGSDAMVTLGPHALILHAAVHLSASFFSFGLKTAWDLLAVLRAEPDFDWSPLLPWTAALRVPRAFWAPMRVLADRLTLPIPPTFLQHAPTDRGARRMEEIARDRIFKAEGIYDLDFATKTGLMLLVLDTWSNRTRYLAAKVCRRGSRPGTWKAAMLRARRADALHQAWRQYRRYRRQ
jgi:hypothetical protein